MLDRLTKSSTWSQTSREGSPLHQGTVQGREAVSPTTASEKARILFHLTHLTVRISQICFPLQRTEDKTTPHWLRKIRFSSAFLCALSALSALSPTQPLDFLERAFKHFQPNLGSVLDLLRTSHIVVVQALVCGILQGPQGHCLCSLAQHLQVCRLCALHSIFSTCSTN